MKVQIISETVQKFNGESFYLCGNYFQRRGKRLHRAVWEYHHGEIPKGYHIHHKDGDRSNNAVENLILLQGSDHLSGHMQSDERKENCKKAIIKAIEAAPAWHRSEKGREWHSTHCKEAWENRTEKKYCCSFCGTYFYTKNRYGNTNHFCSNNCRSAFRRALGVDNEERVCAVCSRTFVVNRYSKAVTCSRECAVKRRWGK